MPQVFPHLHFLQRYICLIRNCQCHLWGVFVQLDSFKADIKENCDARPGPRPCGDDQQWPLPSSEKIHNGGSQPVSLGTSGPKRKLLYKQENTGDEHWPIGSPTALGGTTAAGRPFPFPGCGLHYLLRLLCVTSATLSPSWLL